MVLRLVTFRFIKGLLKNNISGMETVLFLVVLCSHFASVLPIYSPSSLATKFNNTPEHVTVVEGGRVILPCTVEFLGEQSVIWVSPRKTLISHADRRMIDDHRISVERPYINIWNLLIRDVRYNDSGTYECRVNTSPIQIKKVTLEVQVPPAILSQLSSDKVVLEEGQTATLICNVTGIPQPNVTWFKRNYRIPGGIKERIGLEGEVLMIHNITRQCDDIYECFVNNGVPPAISKAIRVVVDYPPEVVISHPRGIGQFLGKETILECQIYAHPQAVTSWMRHGRALIKNEKYDIEVFKSDPENSVTLALRIRDLTPSDYGQYECMASNFLGEDRETMLLYEIKPPPTTTATTSTTTVVPDPSTNRVNTHQIYVDDHHSNGFSHNRQEDHERRGGYVHQSQHALQESPATSSLNSGLSGGRSPNSGGQSNTWYHPDNSKNMSPSVPHLDLKLLMVTLAWTLVACSMLSIIRRSEYV